MIIGAAIAVALAVFILMGFALLKTSARGDEILDNEMVRQSRKVPAKRLSILRQDKEWSESDDNEGAG